MATWQMRRGTAANVEAATPAAGEPQWKTDDKDLVVGDGSTAGGILIGGNNASIKHAKAYAKLDLSGAAASDVVILHTTRACTLVKAVLLYTEASSADAGVTVEIGKETDADYYYTGTSEVSKAQWYEKDVTLLKTDIAAGDTVICGCAGSKVGTGEILVCIEYRIA